MIERNYYTLKQAAKILTYSKEDLIHFGACGKLPIYILTGGFMVMPIFAGSIVISNKLGVKNNLAKLYEQCIYDFITGDKEEPAFIETQPYFFQGDDGQRKSGVLSFGLYYKDRLIYPSAEDYDRFKGFTDTHIFDSLQHPVLLKDCDMVILSDDLKRLQQLEQKTENATNDDAIKPRSGGYSERDEVAIKLVKNKPEVLSMRKGGIKKELQVKWTPLSRLLTV